MTVLLLREQHGLRKSLLRVNQPPEPAVTQLLGSGKMLFSKRTVITERLRDAKRIKVCAINIMSKPSTSCRSQSQSQGLAVPAIKPLMEAIWSAEVRGMFSYYRIAVVLLADIGIDLNLSHTCLGWIEEILPQVRYHLQRGLPMRI